MDEEHFEVCQGVVVPESVLIRPIRKDKYGSVPGLADEELADPDELERQVLQAEWGPVLALPVKGQKSEFRPVMDESGGVDWGAFATVDFDRYRGEFDKLKYKADQLYEKVKDLIIMFDIVKERITGRAKYAVLRYVERGAIDIGQIRDNEMYFLAELYLRIRRLQKEVRQLREASRARKAKRLRAWLEA